MIAEFTKAKLTSSLAVPARQRPEDARLSTLGARVDAWPRVAALIQWACHVEYAPRGVPYRPLRRRAGLLQARRTRPTRHEALRMSPTASEDNHGAPVSLKPHFSGACDTIHVSEPHRKG